MNDNYNRLLAMHQEGLTLLQVLILSHLSLKGTARGTDLATALNVSHPAISRSIAALVTSKYVDEKRGSIDRREVFYSLTAKAHHKFLKGG
jgi:DNA-binding MarR family transcriptional regulator